MGSKRTRKRYLSVKTALAVAVVVVLFLFGLYNSDVILAQAGLSFSFSYAKSYVALMVFHFILAYVLLRYYQPTKILFLSCVITTLIVDCTTYWMGPDLVPLRAPIASLFPIIGVGLAFIWELRSRRYFYYSLLFSIAFVWVVNVKIVPLATEYQLKKKTPNVTSEIGGCKVKTISGKFIRFADSISTPAVLVECYFVGCPGCEVKYALLKRLRASVSSDSLSIVMICAGSVTNWERFLAHAQVNRMEGISFFYDSTNEMNALLGNKLRSFPLEILYSPKASSPIVTLGVQSAKLEEQYQQYILGNAKLQ